MEELRKSWEKGTSTGTVNGFLNKDALHRIIKEKSNQQRNINMHYFWGAFALQLVVYAYLSHVAIRYWTDTVLLSLAVLLIVVNIPFTAVLMKKFKAMAVLKTNDSHLAGLPIREYIQRQHDLLSSFYRFKKRYEIVFGLMSMLILIWIPFRIYVPGGVEAYPITALMIFLVTWISCALIVRNENKRYFKRPLRRLELILYDLNH